MLSTFKKIGLALIVLFIGSGWAITKYPNLANKLKTNIATAQELPNFYVQFDGRGFFRVLRITSHDRRSILVKKVVINQKFNEADCDKTVNQRIALSETIELIASRTCNDPVVVDLYTNVGDEEIELH